MRLRYDNHEAIDNVYHELVTRVNLQSSEILKAKGQQLIITHNNQSSKLFKGVSSNLLLWSDKNKGFLVNIREILPVGKPSIFNTSSFQLTWSDDISVALQFSESESIRILTSRLSRPIGSCATSLRRSWTSSHNWKPGDIEQFPAQHKLDIANLIVEQFPDKQT